MNLSRIRRKYWEKWRNKFIFSQNEISIEAIFVKSKSFVQDSDLEALLWDVSKETRIHRWNYVKRLKFNFIDSGINEKGMKALANMISECFPHIQRLILNFDMKKKNYS